MDLGQFDDAIPLLKAEVEDGRATAECMVSLAECHSGLGALVDAEAVFSKTLNMFPNDPEVHYRYARYLEANEKLSAAIIAIRRSLELSPDDARHRTFLGVVLFRMEDPHGAKREFSRALEIDPGYEEAKMYLEALH